MNIKRLPIIRGINRRLKIFLSTFELYIPPGHYYSPIVSQREIKKEENRIFKQTNDISGIDFNNDLQLFLLENFKDYYRDFIDDYRTNENRKYTPLNGFYGYSDGIFLYSMIRYFKPSKIIEVGSGYSSALMYDVVNIYFKNLVSLVFIEPYPEERLLKFFHDSYKNIEIIKSNVQNISLVKFEQLKKDDILFVDSSHVSKTGSDVNFILFEILPKLNKGVIVHFHDIFYPFEYPKEHVLGKRWFSWNEAYTLRAFLMNNSEWELLFWNSYLESIQGQSLKKYFPDYFKGGSASIWIRKK